MISKRPSLPTRAWQRVLCFLTGHKPGRPTVVIGMDVHSCVRCGRPVDG